MPKYKTVTCKGCAVLVINGLVCHEHGCPEAWKDEKRACKWCGSKFTPEERNQRFCSDDCAQSYNS